MLYRRLGPSGLQISALSFGAWVTFGRQIGDPVARDLMHASYDAGINFFDNAETYADGQAERVMGEILKTSGWRRSSYLVSSKVYFGWEEEKPNQTGLSRKHIVEAIHAQLARLQLEYVDVIFCHRPDYETPLEETCRAMSWIIENNKSFYWGTSEWPADRIAKAIEICEKLNLHKPIVE
jgi:aryl-alcohol dehydrogenase-like predicted oxidoreductase